MASLEFGNLPLVEAACNLALQEPISLDFRTFSKISEQLGDDQFEVLEADLPNPSGPFRIVVGPPPGIVFFSRAHSVDLRLDRTGLSVSWKRLPGTETAYVRFDFLKSLLLRAVGELPEAVVAQVSIIYVNRLAEQENFADFLVPEVIPPLVTDGRDSNTCLELNVVYQPLSGEHIRIQASRGEPNGFVATSCGVVVQTSWADDLSRAHDVMQREFARMISEKAKIEWQLQPH